MSKCANIDLQTHHPDSHNSGVYPPLSIGLDGVKQFPLIVGRVHSRTEVSEEDHTTRCVATLTYTNQTQLNDTSPYQNMQVPFLDPPMKDESRMVL